MTVYHDDGQVRLYQGDVRDVLREMPSGSVQTVVTSPPYWALRDYGIEPSVWDERPDLYQCPVNLPHDWSVASRNGAAEAYTGAGRWQHGSNTDEGHAILRSERPGDWQRVTFESDICGRCGAWRGALGLEPTPELFVAHTVDVFREVRRVLADDGTLWLNIGDSYAGSWGAQGREGSMADRSVISARQIENAPRLGSRTGSRGIRGGSPKHSTGSMLEDGANRRPQDGLKPKDLVGIPWALAFALRADGWYLRSEIIWHKPNPMPESVTDRPTKAHEQLFLLSKKSTYYYDADAIREERQGETHSRGTKRNPPIDNAGIGHTGWVASMNRDDEIVDRNKRSVWSIPTAPFPEAHFATFPPALVEPCVLAGCPEGGTVLDPFVGSGTTAMVARRLGRRAVGIDLNPQYLAMAVRRCGQMSLELTAP